LYLRSVHYIYTNKRGPMDVQDKLLTISPYSRPGRQLVKVTAIVIHWTGNPGATAEQNRDFFEGRKDGKDGTGSAHYCIGYDGEIIRCIPDNEIAYHCGSSANDPASGKIYTDYAREKFGDYCSFPATKSPNSVTIGLELCPIDAAGRFNDKTWAAATELTASLLQKFSLSTDDITTHNKIVGWKNCPKWFVDHPEDFDKFVADVAILI